MKPTPIHLAPLALFLLASGCQTLAPLEFPPDAGGCQSDDACKGDRICVQGACVYPDALPDGGDPDGGVPDGTIPDAGKPDGGGTAPGFGELGGACQLATDCVDPGAVCIQDLPEGYCAIPGCRSCPEGGVCVLTENGEPICIDGCESDADCREGYQCADPFGALACVPSQGGGESPVGGECGTAADCAGVPSFCIADWPGGYCVHGDCDACPEGSACVRDQDFAACMATCQSDADCRPEYVCLNFRREQFCFFGG
ncbi:MAG: hypothetical protein P1V51_14050 [Deltaproteobacteria bacterium]|nr:hypothetical protein [Deltaproteobacteria bacterium]